MVNTALLSTLAACSIGLVLLNLFVIGLFFKVSKRG